MTGFVHRRSVVIEWGDCDAAGIVFYPRYFAMFDRSSHALFSAALGMRHPEMLARFGIIGIPMVDTRARFIVPSTFDDALVIESRVSRFGQSSFDVEHRLLKDDVLAAECWETRVWAGRGDDGRIRGMKLPEEVVSPLLTALPSRA